MKTVMNNMTIISNVVVADNAMWAGSAVCVEKSPEGIGGMGG